MITRHHVYGLFFKSPHSEYGFTLIILNVDKTKQWMHIGLDNSILISKRTTTFEKALYKLIENSNYYYLNHQEVLKHLGIKKVTYRKR